MTEASTSLSTSDIVPSMRASLCGDILPGLRVSLFRDIVPFLRVSLFASYGDLTYRYDGRKDLKKERRLVRGKLNESRD
jgi:hypothetical protein